MLKSLMGNNPGQNVPQNQELLRNIAIIAHVDHGKTTLVDAFLKQSNLFRDNQEEMGQEQIMDSGDLEREKGITIKAKNAAIDYGEYKINVIDTPGHADFGGEVERTLHMADGCLLVVDAQEGPMPQTKFVLQKAFELGMRPIVVINKIDKKHARAGYVLDKLQDLFLSIATTDEQLDFSVLYAIARDGYIYTGLPEPDADGNFPEGDIKPLLDLIVKEVPAPEGDQDGDFQMLISSLELDPHLGSLLIGKISRGKLKLGSNLAVVDEGKVEDKGTAKKMFTRNGFSWVEIDSAVAGEILAITGVDSKNIGATLCAAGKPESLPKIKISNPSVQIQFEANTSPLLGKEGKFVTAKQLQQRLEKELETNISLKISKGDGGSYYVAGRGELQLSILIEELRREGYEFQIRRPEILIEKREDGNYEPLEEVIIDVPEEYIGEVTSMLSERKGDMKDMITESGQTQFTYHIRTRNLLGLRSQLLTATKGNAVINNFLLDYVPVGDEVEFFRKGVLVASESGTSMGYALNTIQERGTLFIGPSETVYEGMLVGINKYDDDMEVNVSKQRQKSGVRMKNDEITHTSLKPTIPVTIDFALGFLAKDELLEVTPQSLRLRKVFLTKNERDWSKRKNLTDFAKQQLGMK